MMIEVVEEINGSDMPRATKVNALALLSLAHQDNGHCTLTWEELARVFGHISIARTRKHLANMQAAELIHYSSNGGGVLYINFKAWLGEKRPSHARKTTIPRAKNDYPTRADESEENESDHPTREKRPSHARKTTTGRAKNDHDLYASAQAVSLLVRSASPSSEEELTNKPTTPGHRRHPWETPLSFRLLTDKRVAMSPKIAERLAAQHTFRDVRDAVAHWYCNRGTRFEEQPGIVIYWLDNPQSAIVPTPCEEFLRSELCRDYPAPDELAAADEAQCQADEELVGAPAADEPDLRYEPDEGTPEWAWLQVRLQLEVEQGGTFDRWVNDTHVVDHDPDSNTFTISLPDAFRYDWIVNRLSKQIVRKLTVITGRKAEVKFIVTGPGSVSRETQSQGDST